MFKQATLLTFIFLALLSGLIFFGVMMPKNTSFKKADPSLPKSRLTMPSRQIRLGIQKDFWIATPQDRLHHRLTSPKSVLITSPHQKHFELVEKLEEMECHLQEKISKKEQTQQVRFIKSHFGTYYYSNQCFEADQVHLALFHLPGNQLETRIDPKLAFLKGIAHKVFLSFSDHKPHFHAEKFQAHIHPSNKVKNYDSRM